MLSFLRKMSSMCFFSKTLFICQELLSERAYSHGVQRRMISVVIFFSIFLRLSFFALLLLYVI